MKLLFANRFEQILAVGSHSSSIWSMDISYDSSYVVSVSQDRSIKIWNRTDDLVFIEEEK